MNYMYVFLFELSVWVINRKTVLWLPFPAVCRNSATVTSGGFSLSATYNFCCSLMFLLSHSCGSWKLSENFPDPCSSQKLRTPLYDMVTILQPPETFSYKNYIYSVSDPSSVHFRGVSSSSFSGWGLMIFSFWYEVLCNAHKVRIVFDFRHLDYDPLFPWKIYWYWTTFFYFWHSCRDTWPLYRTLQAILYANICL